MTNISNQSIMSVNSSIFTLVFFKPTCHGNPVG